MNYANEQEYYESIGGGAAADAEAQHEQETAFAEYELMSELPTMPATAILSLFDTTAIQRQSFANKAIEAVREGLKNPLDVHVQLKCMEDIISRIKDSKEYKESLVEEAIKQGKLFEWHNASVQVKEAGGKWDFSNTNDTTLFELNKEAEEIKKKISDREKFLKTVPAGGMASPETGELIYKAAKPATSTTVAVTLI